MGRLFINPKGYLASGRIIYKVHRGQLSAILRPSLSKISDENELSKKAAPQPIKERIKSQIGQYISGIEDRISYGHLVLLSFVVRRYLSLYGNNWKLIAECVRMNPCFSHLMVDI